MGMRSYGSIAAGFGMHLSDGQEAQLCQYEAFLGGEAVVAGGIGPVEAGRLVDRHVADAFPYATAVGLETANVLDVGSGVGLPGIPVAVVRPDIPVTLLDRSERRTDLASRAVRILGLDNVEVRTSDIGDVRESWDVVMFRASLPVDLAALVARRVLRSTGYAIFGVSRLTDRPELPPPPDGIEFALSDSSMGMLDSPSWLLRMTRNESESKVAQHV